MSDQTFRMFGKEVAGTWFDADTANIEAIGIPAAGKGRVGVAGGFWFGVSVARAGAL